MIRKRQPNCPTMTNVLLLSMVLDWRIHFHVVKFQTHLATDCSNSNRFDFEALWNQFDLELANRAPPQRPIHLTAQNMIQFVGYLLTNGVACNFHELYLSQPFVLLLLPVQPVQQVPAAGVVRLHLLYWNVPVLGSHDGTMVKIHRMKAQIETMMALLQITNKRMKDKETNWEMDGQVKRKFILTKWCSRCPQRSRVCSLQQ